jgi:hypothetical protein
MSYLDSKIHVEIGDLVSRPKAPGLRHVGVVVGFDTILHNLPGKGEHLSTVQEFSSGRLITVNRRGANAAEVFMRARRVSIIQRSTTRSSATANTPRGRS